jgi:ribosomal protein S18 acetylase RimI-like enzyme
MDNIKGDVTIRKLDENDLSSFYNLRLKGLLESPTSFRSSYDEEKAAGMSIHKNSFNRDKMNNNVFGAFVQNEIIGCIAFTQEEKSKTKHKCNIWGLYVQPNYRNQRIGRQLIETTIKHIRENLNCSIINLCVKKDNFSAIKLYESFGFKIWGTEPRAMCFEGEFYEEMYLSLLL